MSKLIKAILILVFALSLCSLSSAQEEWGQAQMVWYVSGGVVYIANPSFYPDENFCFEMPSDGDYDYKIFYKTLADYGVPIEIPNDSINIESVNNFSPFVTYSGNKLYFSSDRQGGYGGYDIWVSVWDGSQWSTPENLGSAINSVENEFGPSLPLDESELYFYRSTSIWHSYNSAILKSDYIDGQWTEPVELPEPVNGDCGEWEPSISADGNKLYFSSLRLDIANNCFAYVTYRNEDTWTEPVPLNDNINQLIWCPWDSTYTGSVTSTAIDSNATSLLFTYMFLFSGCPDVQIRLSNLTLGIDDIKTIPEDVCITIYPNPFNAQTSIHFSLSKPSPVEVKIYDITGRLVQSLFTGNLNGGNHSLAWNAGNFPSGLYFASLKTSEFEEIKKLVLIK